jgi:hypothetical protein
MATQAVAGRPSWSQVPAVHATAGAVPPAQYSPVWHGVHTGVPRADPIPVCCVPAGQSVQARQTDWFTPLVYEPAAHAAHSLLFVAEGWLVT